MNKEEMNNRIQENVQPKYNREKNLNEIKENLTFTDEKEIMENMITEKQNQTKKIRWIALFSIIFACIILIGSNCITYFASSKMQNRNSNNNEIPLKFLKNNFDDYSKYPITSKSVEDEYCIEFYQGTNEYEIKYVYYIYSYLKKNKELQVKISLENTQEEQIIVFNNEKQYSLGILTIENVIEGDLLKINFVEENIELYEFLLII